MRYLVLGAIACVGLASAGQAQTTDPQMMAPISKFIEAFNKGDIAAAEATHAAGADLVIIDEVAPFLWRGAQAFKTWSADLERDAKKRGLIEPSVSIAAATRVETAGDMAYVIVPAVYTFKEGGVAMREAAQMTFTLKKGDRGWLIHGWSWTGPKPQKAGGAAQK